MTAIAFVGYHNSGKTTFITRLTGILRSRGYKVAVLKSTKHTGVFKETPGKDTWCHRTAGASVVGLLSPEGAFVRFEQASVERLALALFPDCDVVLCEGFKNSSLPKLEVYRRELGFEPLYPRLKNVLGVVCESPVEGVRWFPFAKPELTADFVESLVHSHRVRLAVNRQAVALKPFVQSAIAGVVLGFVESLKGCEGAVEVEVKVKRAKP
jgi:molybdopterin-guanine dinucleotide biosynthesis protein B